MDEQEMPLNESSNSEKLHGRYKISFILNASDNDGVEKSDLIQSLAETFEESHILHKIADFNMEKVDKKGNLLSLTLKAGDKVLITQDIKIKSSISYASPHYILGSKESGLETLGETTAVLNNGLIATVNQVKGDQIELFDFDSVIMVPLEDSETLEVAPTPVNVDFVTVSKENLEKVDE